MIVFDLKCDHQHIFEIWFRSSADYETQQMNGFITCPICGSHTVEKAPMAPNVTAKSNQLARDQVGQAKPTQGVGPGVSAPVSDPVPVASKTMDQVARMPASKTPMPTREQVTAFVRALKSHVETTCDNVGDRFPEEVRAIHYGDAEERGIYGNASAEDIEDLMDEGIDILPVPTLPKSDA